MLSLTCIIDNMLYYINGKQTILFLNQIKVLLLVTDIKSSSSSLTAHVLNWMLRIMKSQIATDRFLSPFGPLSFSV